MNPGTGADIPAGSPKLELEDIAYIQGGGPIDTDTWHYYMVT